MKTDKALLEYVLILIEKLQRYVNHVSEEAFLEDEILQDACVTKMVNIGEFSHRISSDMKARNSQVDWGLIKATRNFYVHAYDQLAPVRMWETIQRDIPVLKQQLADILNTENNEPHQ